MQEYRLQEVKNFTTGDVFEGQLSPRSMTTQMDLRASLRDVAIGDVLGHGDSRYLVVFREPVNNRGVHYVSVSCLAASQAIQLTRHGNTIHDDCPAHISTAGLPGDRFTDLLNDAVLPESPFRGQYELCSHLQEAAKLIDPDCPLAESIKAELDRYQGATRCVIQAGSGAAVGDQITAPGQPALTISKIDRKTFSGLEIWTCRPFHNDPKPSLFNRKKGV